MKEARIYSKYEIVSVSIYDNVEYPMHYHPDPEMIFVLEGAARIHTSYYTIDRMEENEFLFINRSTVHNIEKIGSEPCRIMSIHFHMKDIAELFSLPELAAFSIASFDAYCPPNITAQLRKYLVDIASAYFSLPAAKESELSDKVLECYVYMMNNFQWFYYEDYILRNYPQRMPLAQITRAEEILNYVQVHYSDRLTLADVADAFYLNKYYLSHLLKDSLGMNFQDLVNAIRLNIALYPLLDSQKSIDEIAEECGFSSAAYFRKAFAKQAKVPLSRYRKTYAKRTLTIRQPDIREYSAEEQQRLLTEYKRKYFPGEFFATGVKRIPVRVELKAPPYRRRLPAELRAVRLTPQALLMPDQLKVLLGERRIEEVVAVESDFAKMRATCGAGELPGQGGSLEPGESPGARGMSGTGGSLERGDSFGSESFAGLENDLAASEASGEKERSATGSVLGRRNRSESGTAPGRGSLSGYGDRLESWDIFEPVVGLCRGAGIEMGLRVSCGDAGLAEASAGVEDGVPALIRRLRRRQVSDSSGLAKPPGADAGASSIDLIPAVSGTAFSMYGRKGLRTRWYYLYFLLDQLYYEVIFENDSCTITRNGSELGILLYNIPDVPGDMGELSGPGDVPGGMEETPDHEAERKEVFLHLEDIECNYTMVSYTFDFFAESEEDVWRTIGAPEAMGSAVRETIRSSCFPKVAYAHSTSQYDLLREIALEPGELKLLRLIPERGSEVK